MNQDDKQIPPDPKMAARLFELRHEFGYTQKEIGALVGRSAHAVANWEKERHGVSLRMQRGLARVYAVNLAVIRGDEPIPEVTGERQARVDALLEEAEARKKAAARKKKARKKAAASHRGESDPDARRSGGAAAADAPM